MTYQPQVTYYQSALPAPEPTKTNYWQGATASQISAQNLATANATGVTNPVQLTPHGTSPEQQFYCRELEGSWTLRTTNDIMASCQPGRWQYAPGGYPYFERMKGN